MCQKSFVLYTDYAEHIQLLSLEERGMLLTAIFEYVKDGTPPEFTGALGMAFSFIRAQLDRDMGKYNDLVEKRRAAGKRSAEQRKQTPTNPTSVESVEQKVDVSTDTDNDTVNVNDTVNEINNKPKKIKYAEFVSMTNDEYKSLIDRYGETDTKRLIEMLDNYKGSKGKRYKSDYRAILSWCVQRLQEENEKKKGEKMYSDDFNHNELEKFTRGFAV